MQQSLAYSPTTLLRAFYEVLPRRMLRCWSDALRCYYYPVSHLNSAFGHDAPSLSVQEGKERMALTYGNNIFKYPGSILIFVFVTLELVLFFFHPQILSFRREPHILSS